MRQKRRRTQENKRKWPTRSEGSEPEGRLLDGSMSAPWLVDSDFSLEVSEVPIQIKVATMTIAESRSCVCTGQPKLAGRMMPTSETGERSTKGSLKLKFMREGTPRITRAWRFCSFCTGRGWPEQSLYPYLP